MTEINTILMPSRRGMLAGSTRLVLSAGAIALLGNSARAAVAKASVNDVKILNVAVGLEYEGINANAIALKSGLLKQSSVATATKFREDHLKHNEALIATIRKLGGEPVVEKTEAEYAKDLHVERLKNHEDVLSFAAALELGATNAYLGVIPALKDPQLAKIAARLAADEAAHWALLNFDLGRPFMTGLGFGA